MTRKTESETIRVHVNVEMPTAALQTIVENAKKTAGKNEKGYYQIDTAEKVSEIISRYLIETDFETFVKNQ